MHGRFCKFGRPPSATPERKKRQREAPEDRCIVCSASTLSGGKPTLDVLQFDGGAQGAQKKGVEYAGNTTQPEHANWTYESQ